MDFLAQIWFIDVGRTCNYKKDRNKLVVCQLIGTEKNGFDIKSWVDRKKC